MVPALSPLSTRLDIDSFDTFMFDCDGVLWRGESALPGSKQVLDELRRRGKRIIFVTNSSSLSRRQCSHKIKRRIGVDVHHEDIYCSAFAAAAYLDHVGFSGKAYVIGEEGIGLELQEIGIEVVEANKVHSDTMTVAELNDVEIDTSIGAVVVGLDVKLTYTKMAHATFLLNNRPECMFVCTNLDATFPSTKRFLPEGGCIAAVAASVNREPINVGKPTQFLIDHIKKTTGIDASRTLMVGDRIDTDIMFGKAGGIQTALVLTGVTSEHHLNAPDNVVYPDYLLNSIQDILL